MQKIVQKLDRVNGKDGELLKPDKFLKFMIQLLKLITKFLIMNIKLNNINMVTLIGMMVQRVLMVILNIWINQEIHMEKESIYKLLLLMMKIKGPLILFQLLNQRHQVGLNYQTVKDKLARLN